MSAPVLEHVVDNRVLLLGLDQLYRTRMKEHERGELLACARRVATALNVRPASVPIEGYYTEHPHLAIYFRLMRALQGAPQARAREVDKLPEFRRLLGVTSSRIFGPPVRDSLLPVGRDPLAAALEVETDWTVPVLTARAARVARETDDYSLVGLAARAEDPVALAAMRESVVLYALVFGDAAPAMSPRYIWKVDPVLAEAARRFVDAFNRLFGPELPLPTPERASIFWDAFSEADVVGRCVRIADRATVPPRHYHWAVVRGPGEQLAVREFWDEQIWTTQRFRTAGRTFPFSAT